MYEIAMSTWHVSLHDLEERWTFGQLLLFVQRLTERLSPRAQSTEPRTEYVDGKRVRVIPETW